MWGVRDLQPETCNLTNPENFVSLLFWFGLLTYSDPGKLCIPNLTVRDLMYGYLREGYRDTDVFSLDLWGFANLIRNMAYRSEWEQVFRFLADEVEKQTSVRDYLDGEKVVQTFLLAYLNVTDYYLSRSEEMGKGFADLWLDPFTEKYPDLEYSYLIELKYAKRSEFSDKKKDELSAEAKEQLMKYAADDRVVRRSRGTALKCVGLVFSGWELKAAEEYIG